jgi:rRNA maturation protein Nop10
MSTECPECGRYTPSYHCGDIGGGQKFPSRIEVCLECGEIVERFGGEV